MRVLVVGGTGPISTATVRERLAHVAPDRAWITAENVLFPNAFDNAAVRADLAFRQTVPFREGARRLVTWPEVHAGPLDDRRLVAWHRLGGETERALHDSP